MGFGNIRRTVSGSVHWYREIVCEKCSVPFVVVFQLEHTASKSADMFKSRAADEAALVERMKVQLGKKLAKHLPPVPCPGCGHVGRAAALRARFVAMFAYGVVTLAAGCLVLMVAGITQRSATILAAATGGASLLGLSLGARGLAYHHHALPRDVWLELVDQVGNPALAASEAMRRLTA